MQSIRGRFELIQALKNSTVDPFSRGETAAMHGRKIIEGVAFGCLVAIENKLREIPRDAAGQWSATTILRDLKKKGLEVLPSPSDLRPATPEEKVSSRVHWVAEGVAERRITVDGLIEIYKRIHAWMHEANPYAFDGHQQFYEERAPVLWEDLDRLSLFLDRHFIGLQGEAFFCILKDKMDSQTKVFSISKTQSFPAPL